MMSCLNVTGSRTCSCVSLLSIARHPPASRFDFLSSFSLEFLFACQLRISSSFSVWFRSGFLFCFVVAVVVVVVLLPHYSARNIED